MSSQKQTEANRRNGRKSRGPRTAVGKSFSSRNALRHGLTAITRHDPAFSPQIEVIARAICPDTSDPHLFKQALIIGETTLVLRCVRSERIARLERLLDRKASAPSKPASAEKARAKSRQSKASPPLDAMCLGIPELDRLERYERRALSRRKRAIEKFIDISNTTEGSKWEGFGISCITEG